MRQTASAFIEQTSAAGPGDVRQDSILRNELDSLITLYETGMIDPVGLIRDASVQVEIRSGESVPFTG